MRALTAALIVLAGFGVSASLADARPKAAASAESSDVRRKPDLADTVAGQYTGAVISDSRGAGRDGVGFTVTRVGKNLVSVSSDYDRFPQVTILLEKAMSSIVQAKGNNVFVINTAKDANHLDLTIDGASWSGDKSQ